jgi:hypothetical protein
MAPFDGVMPPAAGQTERGTAAVGGLRSSLAEIFEQQLGSWPPPDAEAFVRGLERFISRDESAGIIGVGGGLARA